MRRVLLTLMAIGLWPTLAFGQTTAQVVEYYHTDALGSVRAVTKKVSGQWQVVSRHDFMPFGEEVQPQNPPQDKRLFTGKERDQETGQDYFGARYLSPGRGRFTSADPLTASERISDPRTFNRYSHALNNPLRFLDPDGLEVPRSCSSDPKCTIVVRINVIINERAGVSEKALREYAEFELRRAKSLFESGANIRLELVATVSGIGRPIGSQFYVTGDDPKFLNIMVTDHTGMAAAGSSSLDHDHGDAAVVLIGMKQANSGTLNHEFVHTFWGDPWHPPSSGAIKNWFQQLARDAQVAGALWALSRADQSRLVAGDLRQGLEPRTFAVPANEETHEPKR